MQLIDGDGDFQEDSVKAWVNDTGVADSRANYQVVAIMGPQSSGKSTLMNHVVRWSHMVAMACGDEAVGRWQRLRGAARMRACAACCWHRLRQLSTQHQWPGAGFARVLAMRMH